MALIENIQRENLNCFEEAEAYRAAMREHGLSQEELARRLGRSPSCIANRLRLLRLSEGLRAQILEAGLSERHARTLLRLPDEDSRQQALSRMIGEQLSVRQSEELVERMLKATRAVRCPRVIYRDHRLLVNSIMEFRNKVIQEEVSTEDVDDLLLRIIDAPVKKPKWRKHEER